MRKCVFLPIMTGLLLCLCSCTAFPHDNSGTGDSFSSSEASVSSATPAEIKHVSLMRIQTDKNNYACAPSIYHNEVLICDTFMGERESNVSIYDISSQNETHLPIVAYDAKMDDKNIYYWPVTQKHSDRLFDQLLSRDRQTGEETVLYTIPEGKDAFLQLSYENGYLAWTEYQPVGEGEYLTSVDLRVMSVSGQMVFSKTVFYRSSSGASLRLQNGYFTYVDCQQGIYRICCVALSTGETVFDWETGRTEPGEVCFDGQYLAYSTVMPSGLFLVDLEFETERQIEEGDATDVSLYQNRYLVYTKFFQVYVYDFVKDQEMYNSESEACLKGLFLTEWFHLDQQSGIASFMVIKKGSAE